MISGRRKLKKSNTHAGMAAWFAARGNKNRKSSRIEVNSVKSKEMRWTYGW